MLGDKSILYILRITMANLNLQDTLQELLAIMPDPTGDQLYLTACRLLNCKDLPNSLQVSIEFSYPIAMISSQLKQSITRFLSEKLDKTVEVDLSWKITARSVQTGLNVLPKVKNIIAVASGKGGVGKSTTAVNLALALAAEGAQVGILDADIYGPSQPCMLGLRHVTTKHNQMGRLEPLVKYGIQSMSIAYLIDEKSPALWRGPMVSRALQQLLVETAWQNVDYLIIDLPPGTGDIQLTLAQKIPVTGALIVTTPQDLALLDARKAIEMFRKVDILVLGVVENMSYHVCSQCAHKEAIFGEGGGQRIATNYEVDLLAQLPLDSQIRQQTDAGTPMVIAEPTSLIAAAYRQLGRRVAAKLAKQARNYAAQFPKIVVE